MSNLKGNLDDVYRSMGELIKIANKAKKVISLLSKAASKLNSLLRDQINLSNAKAELQYQKQLLALRKGILNIEEAIKIKRAEAFDGDQWVGNRQLAMDLEILTNSLRINKEALEKVKKEAGLIQMPIKEVTEKVDDLTGSFNDNNSSIKKVNESFDDMDRAMQLIEAQFTELDEAEARNIAGLTKIPTKIKKVEQQTKESTRVMESDWDRLNDNIKSEFLDTVVDMATGAEVTFKDTFRTIGKMWLNTWMNAQFSPSLNISGGGAGGIPGTGGGGFGFSDILSFGKGGYSALS